MADAIQRGVTSEEFGDWRFKIQRNPAILELDETAVPGQFYKQTIDKSVVRKFLRENGAQSWGALKDNGTKLVVKRISSHKVEQIHE